VLSWIEAPFAFSACCPMIPSQQVDRLRTAPPGVATTEETVAANRGFSPSAFSPSEFVAASRLALPAAPDPVPDPAAYGANPVRENVPYTAEWHQQPFSRIGIGADVSLLGFGIKPAIVLNEYFDARGLINFFGYTTNQFEVDGFKINANIHMRSAAVALDVYPYNSIWRLSAGVFFFNGNRVSAATTIAPGTQFNIGSANYYSSNTDPVNGTAVLGLGTAKPEPMVSFGFGRFIPRSNRHWSFPTEFGVIYMGAPSFTVTPAGVVCTNPKQTNCSDIGDPTNPVAIAFNTNLQAKLTQWREDLKRVEFYPIFSYSVVYSFNIR
jgi:hypothetical protein